MIRLDHLEKYYNKGKETQVHALKGVSLEIESGEMVALMGVSGSGKSTLLHILGFLDSFDGGRYDFEGAGTSSLKAEELARLRNEKIGFVMQNFGLILHQNALQNVSLPLLLNKKTKYARIRPRALRLLQDLGIGEKADVPVDQLSGGQQQRVAIARAIANKPKLLLADEPTGALDSQTAEEVMQIFHRLNEEKGMTVILATHDPRIAAECSRILYLEDGRINETQ
ncbi:MAG: ABC transporter ATP-binding protein [Lachnospiraceae bacterium]|nr:ABC transporter ATP-binding protein [Lachnospiraceae bacterium]MBR7076678.1 ABC transporter ATP-binding protein [Lachnospiraceae bacterium]